MLRIPFDPNKSADQSLEVLIPELQVVRLRLVWNTRAAGWDVLVVVQELVFANGLIDHYKYLAA